MSSLSRSAARVLGLAVAIVVSLSTASPAQASHLDGVDNPGVLSGIVPLIGADGVPTRLVGADVSVYTDGDRTANTGADGEGRFSIQVAPGTHTIGVTGRNPATGLLALPEFSGGSRSLEGAVALTVAPGQTIVDADLELDAGGHTRGWPYLVVQPEGTVRGPDAFFTVFTLIHEDAPRGPANAAGPVGIADRRAAGLAAPGTRTVLADRALELVDGRRTVRP